MATAIFELRSRAGLSPVATDDDLHGGKRLSNAMMFRICGPDVKDLIVDLNTYNKITMESNRKLPNT